MRLPNSSRITNYLKALISKITVSKVLAIFVQIVRGTYGALIWALNAGWVWFNASLRVFWRVWCFGSVALVSVTSLVVLLAFAGYSRQASSPVFPNKLTREQDSLYVERMKLSLPFNGALPPFVGIALSGGGSRAANFSLAVLRELDAVGLLEHADSLSSVSGGSLAAAEIGLNLKGPPTDAFWTAADERMRKDLSGAMMKRYFTPTTLFKTFVSSLDRGDVLAQTLDAELYQGATFADIESGGRNYYPGHYKPGIYLNATAVSDPLFTKPFNVDPRLPMGTYMSTFTYSYERFIEMSSEIKTMPIAYAVASSAAFPAAINPISLQMADRGYDGEKREFRDERYIHLADGGLSDNLGTDTVRKVFESRLRNQRVLRDDGTEQFVDRPCLIISIDATSPPKYAPRQASMRADGRATWWSSFIDATAVYGYDAYLLRRRADQLDEMGIDSASMDYGKWRKTRPTAIVDAKLRTRYTRYLRKGMYVAPNTVFTRTQTVEHSEEPVTFDMKEYSCKVWHIALEDLDVRRDERSRGESERQEAIDNGKRNVTLRMIADTALSLETDFKLSSTISPRCTPIQLQSILKRAAQELVQDIKTKREVCAWMQAAKLNTDRCDSHMADFDREPIPEQCIDQAKVPGLAYLSK
jgi:NTE family protein